MDLFAASGIDLGDGGNGGRRRRSAVPRSLKSPLLKHKVVQGALDRFTFDLTDRQLKAAVDYAKTVKSKKFAKMKETAVRPLFCQQVLGEFLGYTQVNPDAAHSLEFELPLGRGSVDVALGRFGSESASEVVAPFELKGPGTKDLDAIMPGRGRSPVQQAWDYANDAPGCRWVLVSNCIELRLYGFGRGRDAYELFDLTKLEDRYEQERLWLLLSADRLLTGATDTLLRESDTAYKTITDNLYVQYSELRRDLINYLAHASDGPMLTLAGAIEPAQKILDRILFIAFAQRTALLPDKLLERARTAINEFQPEPVWRNFRQLFRSVDEGNRRLSIWPYNGGLFSHDPVVDAIDLPDHVATSLARLGEWDYRDDVPVTLLGHLFEQSVTDLEKLRAEARGEAAPKVTKKKREGVVYTPGMVTRFLTAKTIGLTLAERFEALLAKHGKTTPENGDPIFIEGEEAIELAFWRDYAEALRSLRIVDPACGSGAFLVAAFDLLAGEYRRVAARLDDLGAAIDFDPFDEIVTRNLYGVDLNAESVEITRLALWLKTARTEHRLQNLEATIKVGDSLIDDPAFTDHPFDWRAAFPEVFAGGGFDIVIGNPPYVRSELISAIKPHLRKRYEVYHGGADLYCYFYELGCRVMNQTGRLGFISSSSFFKTRSGQNLRTFITGHCQLECGVDFGDAQIFDEVTTYPAVLTLRKRISKVAYSLQFLNFVGGKSDNLASLFEAGQFDYPSSRLARARWHFELKSLFRLRDKLEANASCTLGDIGVPVSGIKTGLTKAFVIDRETHDELVKTDAHSRELLRDWLVGDDLAKWCSQSSRDFLVFIPKGWTKKKYGACTEAHAWSRISSDYPSIAKWLIPFEKKARSRSDKGDYWWELRACDYYELFDQTVITYPEMSQGPKFVMKSAGTVSNNKSFLIPNSDAAILAYLNSRTSWFLLAGICSALRGGKWRLELRADFLIDLPAPSFASSSRARLAQLAETAANLMKSRRTVLADVAKRFFDLTSTSGKAKLSRKLENWHDLDFAAFRAEVKRVFKTEIPVKARGQWETFLAENAEKVRKLTAEIETAEREIDSIVYKLFDLTRDEIALLEASIEGQY